MRQVDLEHPLEQPGPADARRPAVRADCFGCGAFRLAGGPLWRLGQHQRKWLRVRRQFAVFAQRGFVRLAGQSYAVTK